MFALWMLLGGCALFELLEPDPVPACAHEAWYPDADGDGEGEPTGMYVGCTPPAGWVATVADAPDTDGADTDTDGADTDTASDTDTDTL